MPSCSFRKFPQMGFCTGDIYSIFPRIFQISSTEAKMAEIVLSFVVEEALTKDAEEQQMEQMVVRRWLKKLKV
ncbi:hypothetical protein M5689_023150 [Euphorbia peplus]|nr:hypothetical protein M5689_023150 [Euphorbia peplus]